MNKKLPKIFDEKNPSAKTRALNIACIVVGVLTIAAIIVALLVSEDPTRAYADGIGPLDADKITFERGHIEVVFSDVLLSKHEEQRKLIVSEQEATVSVDLTDRLITWLDWDFLKKTQSVSYTGKGYFVVDLSKLTKDCIVQDNKKKTLTIKIDHTYLEGIEIDPYKISVGNVKEGFFMRGDVKLALPDYKTIEEQLRDRLAWKFNTASNGQKADEIALKMVKEIYEPIVKAIDKTYTVNVEFK